MNGEMTAPPMIVSVRSNNRLLKGVPERWDTQELYYQVCRKQGRLMLRAKGGGFY